jgi:hypothetical protein
MKFSYEEESRRFIIELFMGKSLEVICEANEAIKLLN